MLPQPPRTAVMPSADTTAIVPAVRRRTLKAPTLLSDRSTYGHIRSTPREWTRPLPGGGRHTRPVVRHVIALDVGGTGMKAALVGDDGATLHRARRATGRERGPEAVLADILDFAAELRAHGVEHSASPPARAGIAVPRHRRQDHRHRRLRGQPRLAGRPPARPPRRPARGARRPRPRRAHRRPRRGPDRRGPGRGPVPVRAAGHRHRRRDRHRRAGGGRRARLRGRDRPHRRTARRRAPAPAGWRGCLERYASASAVSAAWAAACGDPDADAADCAGAVASGDPNAVRVWREAVDALADGLVTAVTLLDPRTLIIGGGLAEAGKCCSDPCGTPSGSGSPSRNCPPSSPPPSATRPAAWARGCSRGTC